MQTKSVFTSKVFWLNSISIILLVIALPEFISLLPATAMPYIAFGAAILNMILRKYFPSSQPISLTGGYREIK